MWDDADVNERLGHRAARNVRKAALVALMILAAVVAPVALPIRMIIARRQRETIRTEQVVRTDRVAETTLPSTA